MIETKRELKRRQRRRKKLKKLRIKLSNIKDAKEKARIQNKIKKIHPWYVIPE